MAKVCASYVVKNKDKNMKRSLLMAVSLILCVGGFAFDFELDGVYYNVISSQEPFLVEVTSGTAPYTGNVSINKSVTYGGQTYLITRIGNNAFAGCSSLSSVTLPEGLESLGSGSFSGCVALSSVAIPSTVTTIDARSFSACSQLSSVSLPSALMSLGDYCFSGCVSLASIAIPAQVSQLGDYCFSGCTKMESLSLPSSVVQIGKYCFNECIALETLQLSSSLDRLPPFFISGCKQLRDIAIPSSVGTLEESCFANCYIETLTIPNTVSFVNGKFLDKNPNIKSIVFNANVSYIPTYYESSLRIIVGCFNECVALENVEITAPVRTLPAYCFKECMSLKTLSVPTDLAEIGNCCFVNCQSLSEFVIPASVRTIGGACFFNCKQLKSLCIPSGVTELPSVEVHYYEWDYRGHGYKQSMGSSGGCFYGCESLETVDIPSSVASMGYRSFYGCSSLKAISLPSAITSLDREFFSGCKSLTAISMPSTITQLGDNCFDRCESLEAISIPASVTSIGERCFLGCKSLHSIQLPSTITELGESTFSGCSSVKSISIPASVSSIGDGCFSDCSSLESFVIPSSVTKIGGGCFACCTSLKSIEIPQTITELKEGNFNFWWDLDGQQDMSIWSTSGGFFYKCSSLAEIELPSSIVAVGNGCFRECESLAKLTINAERVPETGYAVFEGTPYKSIGCLYVPENSAGAYKTAEQWKDWKNIAAIGGGEIVVEQCETPVISYSNGQLHFSSGTEGAQYHYTIEDSDVTTSSCLSYGDVDLSVTYIVSVFATAEGYINSEIATAILCWVDAEPRTAGIEDGIVEVRSNVVLIQGDNGVLRISGAESGTSISVYDTSGMMAGSAKASDKTTFISTNIRRNEVAIVRIGNKVVKVVMR